MSDKTKLQEIQKIFTKLRLEESSVFRTFQIYKDIFTSTKLNYLITFYSSVESLSSSLLEPGSADTEIVKRNLITDFLSATSIPVNVPLHR